MRLKTTSTSHPVLPTAYSTSAPVQTSHTASATQATVHVHSTPTRRKQRRPEHHWVGVVASFLAPLIFLAVKNTARQVHAPRVESVVGASAPELTPPTFCELTQDAEGTFVFQGDDELIAGVSENQVGQKPRKSFVGFDTHTGKRSKTALSEELYERQFSADRAENLTQLQKRPFTPQADQLPIENALESIAFSADGNYVATAYPERIIVWDRMDGTILTQVTRLNGFYGYSYIQFSPNGNRIGDVHVEGIVLWDWKNTSPRK
jgi:hypothetical protein